MNQIDIEQFLSLNGYDTAVRRARRKNSDVNSQEFFTPYSIVNRMADKIPLEDWINPQKTFCDPCFGNGQFIIYIIWRRLQCGIPYITVLSTTYGVELMEDNCLECRGRILRLLDLLGIEYDLHQVMEILDHNLVCADFFKWNFLEWRTMTEEEINLEKKKPKKKLNDIMK